MGTCSCHQVEIRSLGASWLRYHWWWWYLHFISIVFISSLPSSSLSLFHHPFIVFISSFLSSSSHPSVHSYPTGTILFNSFISHSLSYHFGSSLSLASLPLAYFPASIHPSRSSLLHSYVVIAITVTAMNCFSLLSATCATHSHGAFPHDQCDTLARHGCGDQCDTLARHQGAQRSDSVTRATLSHGRSSA